MSVRRIPFPREHGAWAILFACLLLAWAHPWARVWPATVLALLFVVAFAIQEPLRTAARDGVTATWRWIALYGALLAAGTAYLVVAHRMHLLLPAACAGALLTAVDLAARRYRLHRSAALRLAGAAALTLVLPGMLCLYHPERTGYAFALWWLLVAFFASRLPVVRLRIAARRGETAARTGVLPAQALLYVSVTILVLLGQAPALAFLAVAPATAAALAPARRPSLRRAGWLEVVWLFWFVAVLIGAYHL